MAGRLTIIGVGTNDVLGLLPGCSVRFPLRPDRPSQSKYFIPAPLPAGGWTWTPGSPTRPR